MGCREDTRDRRRTDFPPAGNCQGWASKRGCKRLLEPPRMDSWHRTLCDSYKVLAVLAKDHFLAPPRDYGSSTRTSSQNRNEGSGLAPSPREPNTVQMGRGVRLYWKEIERPSCIPQGMAIGAERGV